MTAFEKKTLLRERNKRDAPENRPAGFDSEQSRRAGGKTQKIPVRTRIRKFFIFMQSNTGGLRLFYLWPVIQHQHRLDSPETPETSNSA
jgi:hypothetical protein